MNIIAKKGERKMKMKLTKYSYKGNIKTIAHYDSHRNAEEMCQRILHQLGLKNPIGTEITIYHDDNGIERKSIWKCQKIGFKRIG